MEVQAIVGGAARPLPLGAGGWIALAFYGPLEAGQLAPAETLAPAFAAEKATLVAVTVDPRFAGEVSTGLPLVSDTQGTLARRFGALVDGEGRFGTVLLDPAGRRRWDDLGSGVSPERALAALRAARGLRPAA